MSIFLFYVSRKPTISTNTPRPPSLRDAVIGRAPHQPVIQTWAWRLNRTDRARVNSGRANTAPCTTVWIAASAKFEACRTMDKTHGFLVVGLSCLLSSFLLRLYADVNEYNKPNQINQVAFDKSRPGGKEKGTVTRLYARKT